MKLFFDTEFTGLYKDTELISIGLITETGENFYAEIIDYDKSKLDSWLRTNVINNLLLKNESENYTNILNNNIYIKGTKKHVKESLLIWLNKFRIVEWVSDVSSYDFVLLIDLLAGSALDMPDKLGSVCYDINQDIAKYYGITQNEAFNKNREEILSEHELYVEGKKHNSLYDAKVIRKIYYIINGAK